MEAISISMKDMNEGELLFRLPLESPSENGIFLNRRAVSGRHYSEKHLPLKTKCARKKSSAKQFQ